MKKITFIFFLFFISIPLSNSFGQNSFCGTNTSNVSNNPNLRLQLNSKLDFETTYVCRLGIIIDSDTYDYYEKDSLTVVKEIKELIARVSTIYLRETNIQLYATAFKIYKEKNDDPFSTYTTGQNIIANMPKFDTFSKENIDKVICVTSKKLSQAVANLNGRYAVTGLNVSVTAHELGHTMGSVHTHDCNWKNSVLDPCFPPENGNCSVTLDQQYPATIMSYGNNYSGSVSFKFEEIINTLRIHAITNFKTKIDKIPNDIILNNSYNLSSNFFEFPTNLEFNKLVIETIYPNNKIEYDTTFNNFMIIENKFQYIKVRVKELNKFGHSNWSNQTTLSFSEDFIEMPKIYNVNGNLINVYSKTNLSFEVIGEPNSQIEYRLREAFTIQGGFEKELISKLTTSNKLDFTIAPYPGYEIAYKLRIRNIQGSKKSFFRDYLLLNEPNKSAIDYTLTNLKNLVNDKFPIFHKRIYLGFCHTPITKLTLSKDIKFEEVVKTKILSSTNNYVSTYFTDLLPNQKYYIKTEDYFEKSRSECFYNYLLKFRSKITLHFC